MTIANQSLVSDIMVINVNNFTNTTVQQLPVTNLSTPFTFTMQLYDQ